MLPTSLLQQFCKDMYPMFSVLLKFVVTFSLMFWKFEWIFSVMLHHGTYIRALMTIYWQLISNMESKLTKRGPYQKYE